MSSSSLEGRSRKRLHALLVGSIVGLLILAITACGSSETQAHDVQVHDVQAHDVQAHAVEAHDVQVHDVHAHDAHVHAAHPTALPAAGELPGTSLYHLSSSWTNSNGEGFVLEELRGGPAVFVMFYGDCTTACPLLVKSAEDIAAALSEEQRAATSFVMVTFDTDRDSPARLEAYAAEKGLDLPNWHWLVGSPLQTRQIATLLGVQYRDAGNGMFAHSNIVTVVDREGVPVARLEGLGIDLEPAVAAIVDPSR